jgi:DNA-binding SARP family transcriptional activator
VPRGSTIVADRFSVGLNPAVVKTDVGDFEAALRAADEADSESERVQSLAEAVELYGGPLLPGYYQDWIIPAQEHLSEQYSQAATALIEQTEAAGQSDRALEFAQRLVALDPLREDAHLHLIRLLARCGHVDAAKRQLARLETVLREEFGESPSETAQQLRRALTHAPDYRPEEEQQPQPSRPASGSQPLPQGTVTLLLVDIEHERELR